VALFVHGKLVDFLPRHRIEGHTAQQVSSELVAMFDEHFAKG
jgi:putative YphP/YqiW family bacilliredoxin